MKLICIFALKLSDSQNRLMPVTPIQGPIFLKNNSVPVVPLYSYPTVNNGTLMQIPVSTNCYWHMKHHPSACRTIRSAKLNINWAHKRGSSFIKAPSFCGLNKQSFTAPAKRTWRIVLLRSIFRHTTECLYWVAAVKSCQFNKEAWNSVSIEIFFSRKMNEFLRVLLFNDWVRDFLLLQRCCLMTSLCLKDADFLQFSPQVAH